MRDVRRNEPSPAWLRYDDAHGIYFLEWCDGGHPHSSAFLTIGLGASTKAVTLITENAFSIEWRPGYGSPMGLHGIGPNS